MNITAKQQKLLRRLPGVDAILLLAEKETANGPIPKTVLVRSAREALADCRRMILAETDTIDESWITAQALLDKTRQLADRHMALNLSRVINATGVIVHTNLGRSLLAQPAISNLTAVAAGYANLEYDLAAGRRGSRYTAVEGIICEISGAEAAMVVNNNAGAVLLCLATLAKDREVIVSRGELVEIGGSFRIPDIISSSGCILKEVGTTNCTHVKDYLQAIGDNTALLLKVHKSNYSVVGFSAEVSVTDLVEIGKKHQLPVMEDLGSGTFIDFSSFGMIKEPTVQDTVAAGVDLATFSGDKLLGGPQAGIIVGKKAFIDPIKQNPLTRALRIDKLTLAALESTMHLYRDPRKAVETIPTLRMLTLPVQVIENRAQRLQSVLEKIDDPRLNTQIVEKSSRAGGGALPLQNLESRCVAIRIDKMSAQSIERYFRASSPPVIGRIEDAMFLMDVRTISDDEFEVIAKTFQSLLQGRRDE
jgi:L-seryl-tRNA(Ser) seleniumtransferase